MRSWIVVSIILEADPNNFGFCVLRSTQTGTTSVADLEINKRQVVSRKWQSPRWDGASLP